MMQEETPTVTHILVREYDPHPLVGRHFVDIVVVSPNQTEEEGTRRTHDGDIRRYPVPIVLWKGVDHFKKERVAWDCAHDIVGNAGGSCASDPRRIGHEGLQSSIAALAEKSAILRLI